MCNDDMDLEDFVKKNKDEIERILKEQDDTFKVKFDVKKDKAEDAVKTVLSLFLNSDVQKHFVKAGIEFLSGVEVLIRNAPLPDEMKENIDKACDVKDKMVKDIVGEFGKPKNKEKKTKKIEVE